MSREDTLERAVTVCAALITLRRAARVLLVEQVWLMVPSARESWLRGVVDHADRQIHRVIEWAGSAPEEEEAEE